MGHGLEIEISRRGVEFDNLHATTLLRLMAASGAVGLCMGFWGGVRAAGTWLQRKPETTGDELLQYSQDGRLGVGIAAIAAVAIIFCDKVFAVAKPFCPLLWFL
eukprot:TRINITY_DN20700_c0_g1_i1.p3 TRINITY_DN20700_c0_g1~~TRINITY_DN20700_c0_g1_i1.p3  ORF type:complete len:104 (+),score=25.88 TRINITY_DN20700_c0_g1_i1:72-383(+)